MRLYFVEVGALKCIQNFLKLVSHLDKLKKLINDQRVDLHMEGGREGDRERGREGCREKEKYIYIYIYIYNNQR